MQKVRISKSFSFETAHALYGYDGKCKNIHGHSYKLTVSILGEPISDPNHTKYGMVIDFGDLKSIVKPRIQDHLDHAILLNGNSPHKTLGKQLIKQDHKVILTPYQPTCENMLLEMIDIIKEQLPKNLEIIYAKLQETENSFVEWFASDNA